MYRLFLIAVVVILGWGDIGFTQTNASPEIVVFRIGANSSFIVGHKVFLELKAFDRESSKLKGELFWGDNSHEIFDLTSNVSVKKEHIYKNIGLFPIYFVVKDGFNTIQSQTIQIYITSYIEIKKLQLNPVTSYKINSPVLIDWAACGLEPLNIAFDFDDGTRQSFSTNCVESQTISHIYQRAGSYTIKMIAIEPNGLSQTKNLLVNIISPYKIKADFRIAPDKNNFIHKSITFTNISSSDRPLVSVVWDFGDGSTSSLSNPIHTYTKAGNYNVKMTVIDDYGTTDSVVKKISVNEPYELNIIDDGDLIKSADSDRIYVVKNSKRYYIPHAKFLPFYLTLNKEIKPVSQATLKKYPEYKLVRYIGRPEVYLIDSNRGLRRHIPTLEIFKSYGFDFKDVFEVKSLEEAHFYKHARFIKIDGSNKIYEFIFKNNRYAKRLISNPTTSQIKEAMIINKTELNYYPTVR